MLRRQWNFYEKRRENNQVKLKKREEIFNKNDENSIKHRTVALKVTLIVKGTFQLEIEWFGGAS
jgi:hypothetical protein